VFDDDGSVTVPAPDFCFSGCRAGADLIEACAGLADDLVALGFAMPSVYLLHGKRLRCVAARGYFQVVDGFRPGTGVIGKAVAAGVGEIIHDVRLRPDFIAATQGLTPGGTQTPQAEREIAFSLMTSMSDPDTQDAVRRLLLGLSNAADDGHISWAQIAVKVVVDEGAADAIEQAARDAGTNPTSRPA